MTPKIQHLNKLACLFYLTCFLFFLTSFTTTYAQSKTSFLHAKKGIAITITGKKVKFRKVRETENSFIFTTINKTEVEIEKFKIAQIDKQRGTKGFRFARNTIGLTSLFVVHAYYLDEYYTGGGPSYEGEVAILTIFLSTITGTIGGLIGLTQKRYKTIYTSPTFGNYEPKLNFKTTSPNAVPSLTLSYTF